MGVTWTEEQQKVISLRDRNILVSAAAGSGKTAVLVQRILSKIMDETHPVDIDRMLIMTFTRAAAGEMKERITAALEQAIYEDPDNDHLQKQMTLIHTAQITTIDGFCSYVIRNYFHMIDLDPGYRTAEEGELKLLREDVLKELLEDAYREKDAKFVELVECYAPGKTDDNIKEMILKLYEAAASHPFPKEWALWKPAPACSSSGRPKGGVRQAGGFQQGFAPIIVRNLQKGKRKPEAFSRPKQGRLGGNFWRKTVFPLTKGSQ